MGRRRRSDQPGHGPDHAKVEGPVASGGTQPVAVACSHCGLELPSKSALFRHLRAPGPCNTKSGLAPGEVAFVKIALLVSHGSTEGIHQGESQLHEDDLIVSILEGCKFYGKAADELRQSASSVIERHVGLMSCSSIVSLKIPSDTQLDTLIECTNQCLSARGCDIKVMNATCVPSNFDADARCSCRRFQALIPLDALSKTAAHPQPLLFLYDAKQIKTDWTKQKLPTPPASFLNAVDCRAPTDIEHDNTTTSSNVWSSCDRNRREPGATFKWTACTPFDFQNDALARWEHRMSEFSVSPEIWICIRISGIWYVCRKNMFPNDSLGSNSTFQCTVLTLRYSNKRFKWVPFDACSLEVSNVPNHSLPSEGYADGVGFIETCYGDEDTESIIELFSVLKLAESADTRDGLNKRFKILLKKFQGNHYFHNISSNATAFVRNAKRTLYNAVCHGTITEDKAEYVVLSFAAHRFSHDEIRRLVALAILMILELLPTDFLTNVLEPGFVVKLPLAPPQMISLVEAHYDGFENATGTQLRPRTGCTGFTSGFTSIHDVISVGIHRSLLRAKVAASERLTSCIHNWISEALPQTVPDLLRQFVQYNNSRQEILSPEVDSNLRCTVFGSTPRNEGLVAKLNILYGSASTTTDSKLMSPSLMQLYTKVLSMLRSIDTSGEWPATGEQRRRRIAGSRGDSFTLGQMPGDHQPLGNKRFPDLLTACYELEEAMLPLRPPSSTVVINRNAQFMPHTDSGAGHGQSKSLIVALGDFEGGELVIEGDPYNINLRPLEFDGWKQRHWTLPFRGERFSIVWFTPNGCTPRAPERSKVLSSGRRIPVLGFGTYRLKGEMARQPVMAALRSGYRHIDTAAVYRNESQIAAVVNAHIFDSASDLVFITTKLGPDSHGYSKAKEAIDSRVSALAGRKSLDLLLMHWPGTSGKHPEDPLNAQRRLETWSAMEEAYNDGKVLSIGVSNFQLKHLKHLLQNCSVMPHVNQIELHPQLPQEELVSFCESKSIQIVAYASLGVGKLLKVPEVVKLSDTLKRTPAQILLRWALQRGFCIIPKATNEDHIRDNSMLFDFSLTEEQVGAIDSLRKHETRYCWDPTIIF